MGREVRARIEQLREKMAERGMDAYLIPTSDFHGSEYVSGYFKCRKYMTGFTGSAGTAIITMEDAGLWTDGRYFVQAAAELSGSGVKLYRSGQEGVPTTLEFLKKHMPEQGVLGFDGRVVDTAEGERIAKALSGKKVRISEGEDLVGNIWDDRPALPMNPVWILEEKYAGKPAAEKIADLRGEMKKCQATVHLLTSLDDIAWLLNIRGNDIPCNPVALSYLAVTKTECRMVSTMAHDGLARSIRPVHTSMDGDTLFTMASGEVKTTIDTVGYLAEEAVRLAVLDAAASAEGMVGSRLAVGFGDDFFCHEMIASCCGWVSLYIPFSDVL